MIELLRKKSWKYLTVGLLLYSVIAGLLVPVPAQLGILDESIRNLFYHVPMWFGMLALYFVGLVYSIKYLLTSAQRHDIIAIGFNRVGMLYCLLGLVTGMIWANYTWGKPWVADDPKLRGAAIGALIYAAYFILRMSIEDIDKKARFSAVYNILAYALLIPVLFILPNMSNTLHPGNDGNARFSSYDIDNNLRMVFYPAILGFIGLGTWLSSLFIRLDYSYYIYQTKS